MSEEFPIEFPITQEHYERAEAHRQANSIRWALGHCLVAEALRDHFGRYSYVSVGYATVSVRDQLYEFDEATEKLIYRYMDRLPITFPQVGHMKGVTY